jgi:vesicle coat complex subunit
MEEEVKFSNLISKDGYSPEDEIRTAALRDCLDKEF